MNYKDETEYLSLISINGMTIPLDNIKIKYINNAIWFKTLEQCPQTIGHMKLLITAIDKIGIFDKFDLLKMRNMDSKKLDVIYGILRIINKIFNSYLTSSTKIIIDEIKDMNIFKNSSYNDSLFDQLTQDIDFFISGIIKKEYPTMNIFNVKNSFIEYLKNTFDKYFYRNIFKKTNNRINERFFTDNDDKFLCMIEKLAIHTKEILFDKCEMMIDLLAKIFSTDCSIKTLQEIISLLKQNDLKNLLKENCLEIDIYSEQKLDYEFRTDKNILSFSKKELIREISDPCC